ncbi:ATP-binding protein [Candidatus Woesearchaeota archaeon]|nr:ATP-binding protein [Candidatus Woesearchaeota archaeon]
MKKYVITGAPNSGKTTIMKALYGRGGIYTVSEVATDIICREMKKGDSKLLPWEDVLAFQRAVLEQQIKWEEEFTAFSRTGLIFQDRGIYDGIAYLNVNDFPVTRDFLQIERRDYDKVFMLDRLKKFETTDIRRDRKLAKSLDIEIEKIYKVFGYETVRVPLIKGNEKKQMVEKRVDFILERI